MQEEALKAAYPDAVHRQEKSQEQRPEAVKS